MPTVCAPCFAQETRFNAPVAVVGANPGKSASFWDVWTDEFGVDKTGWLAAYLQKHGRYSRSRAAIERFVPLVHGRVIELNAHAKQSPRLADLDQLHRTTDVLTYVMKSVRPKVAVCAGADACRAVEALEHDWDMEIVKAKHFIYWGREAEKALAEQVNLLLANGRVPGLPAQ